MKILRFGVVVATAAVLSACATTQQSSPDVQAQLQQAQTQNQQLEAQNKALQQQVAQANQRASTTQQTTPAQSASIRDHISLVPPDAKPGECFARVQTPAQYKTVTQKMLKSAASTRLKTTPAQYKWVTKRIQVSPASSKLVAVPATYKMVSERVLVSEAHDVWKPGHGAIERRSADGDVMCLVHVPAKYKTVKKRVVATAATTKTVDIPAQYKTIKIKELVKAPGAQTIDIPATYQTVSHTEKVRDSKIIWSRVVCADNATKPLITQVQKALKKNGYNPGPIDGLLGPLTVRATNGYDKANDLATSNAGVITYETLKSLGIEQP